MLWQVEVAEARLEAETCPGRAIELVTLKAGGLHSLVLVRVSLLLYRVLTCCTPLERRLPEVPLIDRTLYEVCWAVLGRSNNAAFMRKREIPGMPYKSQS